MSVEFVEPPSGSSDEEQLDSGPARLPRRLAIALTLAVAAGVTGFAINALRHNGSTPARHTAVATTHPSPATPPGLRSCLAAAPAQWSAAAAAATGTLTRQFTAAAVTADGSLIGGYFPAGLPAGTVGFDLLVVASGSDTVRTLASFRGRSSGLQPELRVDGHTVLVLLDYGTGNAPFSADQISAVDTRSGRRTTVLDFGARKHPLVADAVLFGGSVYWSEALPGTPDRSFVQRFDLSNGKRTIVFRSNGSAPSLVASAAGLEWSGDDHLDLAAPVPSEVAAHISGGESSSSLITDGSGYAWTSADGVGWWAPGFSVADVRLTGAGVTAVAGPFVATFGDGGSQIVDMRTGARILTGRAFFFGAAGVLITDRDPFAERDPSAEGGTDADGRTVVRLPITALPELRC